MDTIEISILDIVRRKGATPLPKVLHRHCEGLADAGFLARSEDRWILTDAGWDELRFQECLIDNRVADELRRAKSAAGQRAA